MARVLVTGASGFIGRHVVGYFSEHDHEVACLMRRNSDSSGLRAFDPELVYGDVTDPDSLKTAVRDRDVVVNLAGIIKTLRRQKMYDVNERGAGNIVGACAAQPNPPVLIHVSSLAAAGPATNNQPVTERRADHPVSAYGHSKLAGEQAMIAFADRVPISILRPPIVFGQGDKNLFEIFKSVKKFGLAFSPPFGDQIFSVVHVADLSRAIRLTAEVGQRIHGSARQGLYYVSSPESPSFNDLARIIGRIFNRDRVRIIQGPRIAAWGIGLLCEISAQILRRPFIMNLDKAREAVAGSWSCNASSINELGFTADPLWNRLRQTAEWYLRQGWLTDSSATPFAPQSSNSQVAIGAQRGEEG